MISSAGQVRRLHVASDEAEKRRMNVHVQRGCARPDPRDRRRWLRWRRRDDRQEPQGHRRPAPGRDPERHDARVLEEHPRRRDQGAARVRGPGRGRAAHLEGPDPRGRPRAADPGRRRVPQPGRQRHRARAARRQRARPPGPGSQARRHSHRRHRLGAGLGRRRQLRRHRQREGRRARGRSARHVAAGARAACSSCATRKDRRAPRLARRASSIA